MSMASRDRIAEPWGARTPYAPGEPWPVRVDSFLVDGLSERDVDRWTQSAAVLHSNGDGLDIAVKDGRIAGVRGRGGDRVNHGRLDPKDLRRLAARPSRGDRRVGGLADAGPGGTGHEGRGPTRLGESVPSGDAAPD